MISTPAIRIALQSRRARPIQKKLSVWQMLEGPAEDVWPANEPHAEEEATYVRVKVREDGDTIECGDLALRT
jgi:hypothetical protein